jgi:hypothetical protein
MSKILFGNTRPSFRSWSWITSRAASEGMEIPPRSPKKDTEMPPLSRRNLRSAAAPSPLSIHLPLVYLNQILERLKKQEHTVFGWCESIIDLLAANGNVFDSSGTNENSCCYMVGTLNRGGLCNVCGTYKQIFPHIIIIYLSELGCW